MELIFLTILLLVTLFYLYYVSKPKPSIENNNAADQKLQLPPGGSGWPFVGETMEYHKMAKRGLIDQFISDRMRKYSSKLFKTSYLGQNMVFLCSAEGNKFLFSNENKLVKPWLPGFVEKFFTNPDKKSLSQEFMSSRKASIMFTEPMSLKNYVGIVDAATKQHLHKYWDFKQEVKVHSLAKKFTFELACQLMLNIQDPETTDELEKLTDCIMTEFFVLPIIIPGTKCHRAITAMKELRQKLGAIVNQRKNEVMEKRMPEFKDILSLLVLEKDKNGEGKPESVIVMNLIALLLGAYDNPSITMVSILKYLAELPHVYEEVRREQMEIANSKGAEELLTFEDTKKMKYTWNVICEVLRLEPPNSGTFREALTDISFDGYVIPKGWKLHWAVHASHKNPEYFKDPEKFDPSRFERNEIVPFSYVPFGGGPRICPGKEYARLQLLVFVHNMINKFRWEKVLPDEKLIRSPNLKPEKGFPIRLYPLEL
ncbi:Cytochrome P450 [Melia azedarach]|uniref:Cytochrome P450 n=1 Tax=Melia azedarach TaxID=155640 RepID=A0ACC1Y167_MELAZ|nr:Cytochrome P450 [Melia azedarach]